MDLTEKCRFDAVENTGLRIFLITQRGQLLIRQLNFNYHAFALQKVL